MDMYIISLEEILWGGFLVAITMSVHGTGMFVILQITDSLKERFGPIESFLGGLSVVVLASWLIILTNLVEVMAWAAFYVLQDAQPNHSIAFYHALLNYTTLQADYLPRHWRLLEALLGMVGLLTVAWSTGILFMLARDFQETQLRIRKHKLQVKKSSTRQPDSSAP